LPQPFAAAVDGDFAVFAHLFGKIIFSGFLGGTIAALSGIVPSQAKDDLARAVHRTLLWSVLSLLVLASYIIQAFTVFA